MKFMMFMIPNVYQPGTPESEQARKGHVPDAEAVKEMMKYNEQLAEAGILVSLNGLHPPADGVRISFREESPRVIDGPFTEAKEVVGGYWILNVKSKEEAIEWARKCPAEKGDLLELRQIFEMEEFPEEVQKLADNPAVNDAISKGES